MNRSNYFNYIEEKINFLAFRISQRGKINLLDLNIHSETFFADMLNLLFQYKLRNLNAIKHNVEGIDLIDTENKIIAQVSSICTKQKIESSLKKDILKTYKGYRFKFVAISENADKLRNYSYNNPHSSNFQPIDDIIDITSIGKVVLNMNIDEQKRFYDFIKKELGNEIDIVKIDSNLATIINILSNQDLTDTNDCIELNAFEIDKKIEFNQLTLVKDIINEYKVYYNTLNEKYNEFDKQGSNRSLSVLRVLHGQYIKLSTTYATAHQLFYAIINSVIDIIQNSNNYIAIPYEELEMCVYIIVVDAFVKCKIFKNPEGYNYVIT